MYFKKLLITSFLFCAAHIMLNAQTETINTIVIEQNQEAELAYNNGIQLLNAQQYGQAIQQFELAIRYNPQFLKAYINLGAAKTYTNDLDGAISAYNYVLGVDSTIAQVWYSRAMVYFSKNDFMSCLRDVTKAILLQYETAEAYYYQGVCMFFIKDYKGAVSAYTNAIQLNPRYAYAYNDRGSARRMMGDIDRAVGDYEQALRLNPEMANTYDNLGSVLLKSGDIEGAIRNFDLAIKWKPDF
ncbi:MAG TPA: tetratricopeptide repeat protein, partial [Bacteroidales bacterium]|nr:tetratricopeptide repeat protein [Bacteroidales bacterium]